MELLQFKGDGERFASYVDRLIRNEAALRGLPQSDVRTQLRVTIKDGGVDTELTKPIPNDRTGWFSVPTCWQFKAVEANSIDDAAKKKKLNHLQAEIRKPYVQQLIRQGYGYRFCLLGDLPPVKNRVEWEAQLNAEAKSIHPGAADVKVVHGGDLLTWTERFPALVLWLKGISAAVLPMDAWRQSCRDWTPAYVTNPEWGGVHDQIHQHVSFNKTCVGGNPCLTIGGAAGIGKTRLVFESLEELPESAGLVVYALDEQEAKIIVTGIVNSPSVSAVVVADECTPLTRHFLNEISKGNVNRVRIICLDNTGEKLASQASQVWLSSKALKNTGEILSANFPDVPRDRRHQYASLAEGFVRLAADMCRHDEDLKAGDLARLPASLEQYVRHRVDADKLDLIALLALFPKIGFRQEVEDEIKALADISGQHVQKFHEAVHRVRESPGFVVQAGRYWYVTPEIVGRILFAQGWFRWVKNDPARFLQQLPDHLKQPFIDRAGKLGNEEVRDQVAGFFRRWFDQLSITQLALPEAAALVEVIVEAAPAEYLPRLRTLLEQAGSDDLLRISGDGIGAKWGPRRALVWLLERLVSFPEYFADCEACLFRLALYESEPQIGNNATRIWQGLFNVHLSGTAAPFLDRARILRDRTFASNLEEARLAFSGLNQALSLATGHVVGPPVVTGRLRPADWQPETYGDERACYRQAVAVCGEHITGQNSARRRLAMDVLLKATHFVLHHGLCAELRNALQRDQMSDADIRILVKETDEFVHIQHETGRAEINDKARSYVQTIREWADCLRPSDFDGVLRSVCSRDPWDNQFADGQRTATDDFESLALQIRAQPQLLTPHLDWLASTEAASAERLGFAIGKCEEAFSCGRMIWEHTILQGAAPLLRGYVRGFVTANRVPSSEELSLLERLEVGHPAIAVDILSFAGDAFDGLNRVVRLVEQKTVPVRTLTAFAMGVGQRSLRTSEAKRLLDYFTSPSALEIPETIKAGVRFLATIQHRRSAEKDSGDLLDDDELRANAWTLVECSLPSISGHLAYDWKHLVAELTRYDRRRGCHLLGQALLSENLEVGRQAEEELERLATENPDEVMNGIGVALLNPREGWRLQVHVLSGLVDSIPPSIVAKWVETHGLEAARKIARHLPPPFVDEAGNPVVPTSLQLVLELYDDERVFENFVAGAHSGEVWWGNAADRFRIEAEHARRFLNHENRWIREWAKQEISSRLSMAELEAREHAERFLPS